MRVLTAVPVYNEEKHVERVLAQVRPFAEHLLVINDGSNDGTADRLSHVPGVHLIHHPKNRGYGAALISAFSYALEHGYDALLTMDCDGQHEPALLPSLVAGLRDADLVSGSRYLREFHEDTPAPEDRRRINFTITRELNARYNLHLTDSFCGFKGYRREALARLCITERSWGMPLQLWVQAAHAGLRISEVAVPRVYLDPNRAFGGVMNDAEERLAYYRRVIVQTEAEVTAHRDVPAVLACCHAACGAAS